MRRFTDSRLCRIREGSRSLFLIGLSTQPLSLAGIGLATRRTLHCGVFLAVIVIFRGCACYDTCPDLLAFGFRTIACKKCLDTAVSSRGLLFIFFLVSETKGHALQEIEHRGEIERIESKEWDVLENFIRNHILWS